MATSYPKGWRGSLQLTVGAAWNRLTSRAGGKYGFKGYEHVEVRMTRAEFVAWALPEYALWFRSRPDETPSIDRIDNDGHYELANIRLVSLAENLRNTPYHGKNVNAPPGILWCGRCKQYLPLDRFGTDSHKKNGYRPQCMACVREYQKSRRNGPGLPWDSDLKKRLDAPGGQSWCKVCQQYLPAAEFSKSAIHKTGLFPDCRVCVRKQRIANPKPEPRFHRNKDAPKGKHWCSRCRAYLPISKFNRDIHRASGLKNVCRTCFSIQRKEYPSRKYS